jgi:hypothetical protein
MPWDHIAESILDNILLEKVFFLHSVQQHFALCDWHTVRNTHELRECRFWIVFIALWNIGARSLDWGVKHSLPRFIIFIKFIAKHIRFHILLKEDSFILYYRKALSNIDEASS